MDNHNQPRARKRAFAILALLGVLAVAAGLAYIVVFLRSRGFTCTRDARGQTICYVFSPHPLPEGCPPDCAGTNLHEANLIGASFVEADLSVVNLGRADLRTATLIQADLSRANLRRADLRWALLSETDARRANLERVDLSQADLHEANLASLNCAGPR